MNTLAIPAACCGATARRLVRQFPLIGAMLAGAVMLGGCATSGHLSAGERQHIAGRTYVVTGASSGIGRGVAVRLGELGANVVLAARRDDVLQQVASEVRAAGGAALVVPTDVAQAEAVQRLADAAVQRFGRVDVWINDAAVMAIGRFEQIPIADHSRLVDVNLKGVIYGSHVALRQFVAQGGGTLINLGSVESKVPQAYHASYAATKAAILALDHALRQELRLAGLGESIHVVTVMPWATDTPLFNVAANYSGHAGRSVALDDTEKVVNVVIRASLSPRPEYPVGWKARGALLSHRLAPGLTTRLSSSIAHEAQMEDAAPAPDTAGNLHRPPTQTTGVDGGVRQRIEREDSAAKTKPAQQ